MNRAGHQVKLPTIRDGMRKRLGADVEIRVEEMAMLPRERSGKHRYVVSKVAA